MAAVGRIRLKPSLTEKDWVVVTGHREIANKDMHPIGVGRSVSCLPNDHNQFVAGSQFNTFRPPHGGYGAESSMMRSEEQAPGINMLLKDIPTDVHQTIVKLLNVEDTLRKDWRALAGCMKLSVEDTNTLKQENKMDGLFETMIQRHMRVRDLVGFLTNKEVDRRDVIDELKKANLVNDSDLPSFTDEECDDSDRTEELSEVSSQVVTEIFSAFEHAVPEPQLLSPHQNQNSECGKDDTTRHPVQQESAADKGLAKEVSPSDCKGASKPPSSPQQETNPKSGRESTSRQPSENESGNDDDHISERLEELQVSDNDDDIHEKGVSKVALIIGCLKYEKLDSLENFTKNIKKLNHALDMCNWTVTREMDRQRCSSVALKMEIQNFVHENEGNVCLVYLVGHTVQINAVNYLLPTDVDPDMTKADLVACSVDINQLICSLRTSYLSVVFLDGAHQCTQDFQCTAVLTGLAPVSPLPNIVVASPCRPGTTRTAKERHHYIDSLIKHLETEDLPVGGLFAQIRKDMNGLGASSPPVEYSLTRSGLPFCFKSEEGSVGMWLPNEDTPRHAIIFATAQGHQTSHTDHLEEALQKARWATEQHKDLTGACIKEVLRDRLKELSGPEMKVVMVYFIGAAFQTESGENFLAGIDGLPDNNASSIHVPVQWIVDLMCELVIGPKLLVVDDVENSRERGLASMTAPQECLLSLPCARDSDRPTEYTLRLSQLIGFNPGSPMRKILSRVSHKEHHIDSNLFFA